MEYASTRLMSSCTKARAAAMIIVMPAMNAIQFSPPWAMEKPSQNTP